MIVDNVDQEHILPASSLPGLLHGWCGPVQVPINLKWRTKHWDAQYPVKWETQYLLGIVRLDLRRPECAHRVRDFLRPALQKMHGIDMDWTRDIPSWKAAAILGATARRVVTGEPPIRALVQDEPAHTEGDNMATLTAGYAIDKGDHILIPMVGGRVGRVDAP